MEERDTIVTAKGGKDSVGRMAKYERKKDEILRMQALNWGALHPRWAGKRIKRRSDFSWLRHVQSNQVPGGCSKLAKKRDALHCDPLGVTVVLVASEPIANFLRSCYQTRTKKNSGRDRRVLSGAHQRQRVLTLTMAYQHPLTPVGMAMLPYGNTHTQLCVLFCNWRNLNQT